MGLFRNSVPYVPTLQDVIFREMSFIIGTMFLAVLFMGIALWWTAYNHDYLHKIFGLQRVPERVPQRMPGCVYERATQRAPNWEPGDYEFSDESEEEEEEYLVPFIFNDRKAKKNAPTCVICLTNRVLCKNMPCGCSVMCGECATKLIRKTDICPTCRAEIKQIKVL